MGRILLMFCLLSLTVQAQNSDRQARRQMRFESLCRLVETRHYQFEAQKAISGMFRPIHLTSAPNSIEVTDSLVKVDLPFFGRAYSADYGGEGAFRVKGVAIDYQMDVDDRKQRVFVSFKVKTDNDLLHIRLEAFDLNSCQVNVTSNNRAFISYQGVLLKKPD
jgi:hypothetical protein